MTFSTVDPTTGELLQEVRYQPAERQRAGEQQ